MSIVSLLISSLFSFGADLSHLWSLICPPLAAQSAPHWRSASTPSHSWGRRYSYTPFSIRSESRGGRGVGSEGGGEGGDGREGREMRMEERRWGGKEGDGEG